MMRRIELEWLDAAFALARFAADDALPAWASGAFVSVTRTDRELSIIAPASRVPWSLQVGPLLCAARVHGTLESTLVGILLRITAPLADAGIPILALSTADTDYFFLARERQREASDAWIAAGIGVRPDAVAVA